jgi:hypothetical protein
MTTGEHEMPPHLERYVASLTDPRPVADASPRVTTTPVYDAGRYLFPAPAAPEASESGQESGHIDPAAAARWHQAQTELAGLIRAEGRTLAADPQAAPVLAGELAVWMEQRVAGLEQAETAEPEIG